MFFLNALNIRFYQYLNICRAGILPRAPRYIHTRYFSSTALPFYNILTLNRAEFCHLMNKYHYDDFSCEEQRRFFASMQSKYKFAPWPTEYFDLLLAGEQDNLRLVIHAGVKDCFYSFGGSDELTPGTEDITIYAIITAGADLRESADLFIAATDMKYLRDLVSYGDAVRDAVVDLTHFFVYELSNVAAAKKWT